MSSFWQRSFGEQQSTFACTRHAPRLRELTPISYNEMNLGSATLVWLA
jgi:hypothetical protein